MSKTNQNISIAVVIPTFNRCKYAVSLLNCLRNQKLAEHVSYVPVVVIDGSTDGTQEVVSKEFPEAHQVNGNGNWWFTRSMNEGFRYAGTLDPDFVLVLNDDIELKENYLQNLVEDYLSIGEECIMGSITVSIEKPAKIFFSGTYKEKKFPYRQIQYLPFLQEIDVDTISGIKPSKELTGRGSLIPYKILEELDFFDEHFPQYHSDFDFALRAAKKGYNTYISFRSIMFTHIMETSDSSTFKRIGIRKFIKNLANPYSRKNISQNARMIWRHKPKALFMFLFLKWMLLIVSNHLRYNLIASKHES